MFMIMMSVKVMTTLRLNLLHIEYSKMGTSWNYENVISPFSRLYLITNGQASVYHNHREFSLTPNNLYLIPAFSPSRYQCDHHMEHYFVHFTDEIEGGFSIFELFHFLYKVKAHNLDIELFRRLLEINPDRKLYNHDPRVYDNKPDLLTSHSRDIEEPSSQFIETEGILLQLFSRFLGEFRLQSLSSFHRMNHVTQFIKENMANPITIEMLSDQVCLSPDYFSRLFLKITGIRPIDYINRKRIEKAQLLMVVTSLSLKEICDHVGICSMSYFNRLFKKYVHISPGIYRRKVFQQKETVYSIFSDVHKSDH